MKYSVALFRAADILERVGWCRGTLYNAKGQVCMTGAINMAFNDERPFCFAEYSCVPIMEELAKDVAEPHGYFGNVLQALSTFNDLHARDRRQVQRKLRKFARIAQERGE